LGRLPITQQTILNNVVGKAYKNYKKQLSVVSNTKATLNQVPDEEFVISSGTKRREKLFKLYAELKNKGLFTNVAKPDDNSYTLLNKAFSNIAKKNIDSNKLLSTIASQRQVKLDKNSKTLMEIFEEFDKLLGGKK